MVSSDHQTMWYPQHGSSSYQPGRCATEKEDLSVFEVLSGIQPKPPATEGASCTCVGERLPLCRRLQHGLQVRVGAWRHSWGGGAVRGGTFENHGGVMIERGGKVRGGCRIAKGVQLGHAVLAAVASP